MIPRSPDGARVVKRHFKSHGWKVSETQKANEDVYVAEKEGIKILIRCVDHSFQKHLGVSVFLERLRDYHQAYRNRSGEGVVFVIDKPIVGLSFSSLVDSDIALYHLEELPDLTNMGKFYKDKLPPHDGRERLVLKGCPVFCSMIAESLRGAGDVPSAIEWLKIAIDGTRHVHNPHYSLIDCYFRTRDFAAARELVEKLLSLQANNIALIEKLRELELVGKNFEAAARLEKRIGTLSQERPSFAKIVARQKVLNPETALPSAVRPASHPFYDQRWIKRLFFWRQ